MSSRIALLGVLAALAVGVTACSGDKSTSSTTASTATTTSTDTTASSTILPVAKRGVVTIQTAVVGDPGNPSVGVWQVFKTLGSSGASVTLPPDNSPGVYKSCDDAPAS